MIIKSSTNNHLIKQIYAGIKLLSPTLIHECPYEVLEGYNIIAKNLPFSMILPTGDYKFVVICRFLDKDTVDMNITLIFSTNTLKDRMG